MSLFSKVKSAASNFVKNVATGAKYVGSLITGQGASPLLRPTTTPTPSNATPAGSSQNFRPYAASPYAGTVNFSPSAQPPAPKTITAPSSGGGGSRGGISESTYAPSFGSPTTITASKLSSPMTFSGSSSSLSAPSSFTNTAITLPSAPGATPASFDMNSLLTPALASQGYTIKDNQLVLPVDETQEVVDPTLGRWDKIKKSLESMLPKPESTADTYKDLERQTGVIEKRNLVNSLASQLNNITSKRDADVLNLRNIGSKEGVTETVYGGQASVIEREAAIRALPVAAQLSAAQNDLQTAESHLEKYFSIVTQDNQNKLNYQWKLLDSVMNYADKEDQKLLNAKKEEVSRNSSNATNALNFAQQTALKALENGNQSAYSQIISLPQPDANSPTFAQDLQNYNNKVASLGSTITPKTTGGVGAGAVSETVQTYANLLAQGKISLSNVPQNIRNAVVAASNGVINKPLSDTAVKEITQTQSAITNLQALKTVVQSNLQFIGPLSGFQRLNPYSDARKVQAEVDRVRQIVGKTLEGGVLRKEDEEKYKKILATLNDTPETAIYKIDALMGQLERDIESYQSNQAASGRYVGGSTSVPKTEDLRSKYNY